ncbi:hypothetical protein KY285_028319 [Solanum tuberosum]|nr:hypothetical protein KY285_028319 [Solanum tuberosum]
MSIRMWFLIQQFMTRNDLVERPPSDYIHCTLVPVESGGIFNRVFNVDVSDLNNHETLNGSTIANAYCVQCGTMLGWKFIAIHQPEMYVREGRFFMNLYKLTSSNDVLLLRFKEEQYLGTNEENADQDGDANEKNAVQDGDATDQDGDDTDQDGDTTDQDGNSNGQNAHQDGDSADQDGDATEQYLGANERPSSDDIHCRRCSTRVALVEDYILTENNLLIAGFFDKLFNVDVAEDVPQVVYGNTIAKTCCVHCRNMLGWKLIAVSQLFRNFREGFYTRLDELTYWNDVTLLDFLSEGDSDQDGDDNEQDLDIAEGMGNIDLNANI